MKKEKGIYCFGRQEWHKTERLKSLERLERLRKEILKSRNPDAVTDSNTVIDAIASGKLASESIDKWR